MDKICLEIAMLSISTRVVMFDSQIGKNQQECPVSQKCDFENQITWPQ